MMILKVGMLDIINTKKSEYKSILGEYGFSKKEYQGRKYTYIEFNNLEKEIRNVVFYAINKNEIISKVFNGNVYNIDFPLDLSSWLFNDEASYKYDIEKSIQILEENGWKYSEESWNKNDNKLILNFLIESTDKINNEIAYIIKEQLNKIGININIEKVSKNLYNYYLKNKKYDIIIKNKIIGISPNLNSFFEDSSVIESMYKSENERELVTLFKQLQDDYNLEIPFIMLCCSKHTLLYNDKIYGNIRPNWYSIFYDIENWKKIYKNT